MGLSWEQVEFTDKLISLNPGETKNEKPRTVAMTGDLLEELRLQRKLRDEKFPFCQFVFFNHSTGRPIKDFRGAWATACKKVGLPDALFHDLRRTGVRNLVRAGVSEKVAMAISGHKTRSVFDRYDITDIEDVQNAARAVEAYHRRSEENIKQVVELREVRPHTSAHKKASEQKEAVGT